jgi:hypothetical protein
MDEKDRRRKIEDWNEVVAPAIINKRTVASKHDNLPLAKC